MDFRPTEEQVLLRRSVREFADMAFGHAGLDPKPKSGPTSVSGTRINIFRSS